MIVFVGCYLSIQMGRSRDTQAIREFPYWPTDFLNFIPSNGSPVLKKYENLPDQDHVVRCVGWTKLRRDGEDNDRVIGFLGTAFQRNPDHDGLSVNWLEYF